MITISPMEIASSTDQLSHETHVHGVATLNVLLEDHAVFMEFESPAMNLWGFEHAPVNDEQNALFISTQRTLRRYEPIIFVLGYDMPGGKCGYPNA